MRMADQRSAIRMPVLFAFVFEQNLVDRKV
jgi:hypothetical protein